MHYIILFQYFCYFITVHFTTISCFPFLMHVFVDLLYAVNISILLILHIKRLLILSKLVMLLNLISI